MVYFYTRFWIGISRTIPGQLKYVTWNSEGGVLRESFMRGGDLEWNWLGPYYGYDSRDENDFYDTVDKCIARGYQTLTQGVRSFRASQRAYPDPADNPEIRELGLMEHATG